MKINNSENQYSGIYFFNESQITIPVNHSVCKKIAGLIEKNDSSCFQLVEIAFVDEEEIVRINKEHLERSYITDIISFRYDENKSNQAIEGTLYCCAPRINEQATDYTQSLETEFYRVIIHGLLHLIGYEDQSKSAKKDMRNREDFYLEQLKHAKG